MAEEEAEIVAKKRKEICGQVVTTVKKHSASGATNKGFKIRPERSTRLSDVKMARQEVSG